MKNNNLYIKKQNTKKIDKEFKKADKLLKNINPAITIYGSSRVKRNDEYYQKAIELGEKLAKDGYDIITGGGPGIMEAVNEGAYRINDTNSIGLGIKLPYETSLNRYINIGYTFKYFFIRKVMMVKYSQGFVIFPGGMGTLDELFETLTLIQTSKTGKGKIYLYGIDYYSGLIEWMKNQMLKEEYIKQEDLENIILTDDINEIVKGFN